MSSLVGAALLALLVLAGIARVLYPSLRLHWVRRQLVVADAMASAASEWLMSRENAPVTR